MKHTFILFALLALGSLGARAQWLDFSSNQRRFSIGFQLGQSATGTDYAKLGFGISVQAYGFQVDFLRVVPEHKYDNHVNNIIYRDSSSYSINLGYQVPILPWLRLVPVVGYCQTNYGNTDASTVNIETDENSSSMYHDYTVTPGSRRHYFNYGLGISVKPYRYVDLHFVYSARAIYGGISFNFEPLINGD